MPPNLVVLSVPPDFPRAYWLDMLGLPMPFDSQGEPGRYKVR